MKHDKTERRSPSWPPLWGALADACGGPQGLAGELRKHYQTVWRWALRDWPVPPLETQAIRELAARKNVKSPV